MSAHREIRNTLPCPVRTTAILSAILACLCLCFQHVQAKPPKAKEPAAAAPATKPALEEAFTQMTKYEFGQSRLCLTVVDEYVRSLTGPEDRKKVASRLAGLLGSDATKECKRFICRELVYVGGAESLPALTALLADEELSDMARFALERMTVPGVDEVLRDALGKSKGKVLVGVINTLGERRDPKAVATIADLLAKNTVSNVELSSAAAAALGKIATPEAAAALKKAHDQIGTISPHVDLQKYKAAVDDAYLCCADRMLQAGKKDEAGAIYKEMYLPLGDKRTAIAALRGLCAVRGEAALPDLLGLLNGTDDQLRLVAIGLMREIPGASVTGALVATMPKLPPAGQASVLDILAARDDASGRPAAMEAAKSKDDVIRAAGLRALGRLGDATALPLLSQAAANTTDAGERDVARQSLNSMRGKDIEPAMVSLLPQAEPKVKVEVIKALAARRAPQGPETLLRYAEDPDAAVRMESLNGLRDVADEKELVALVKLTVKSQPNDEQQAAEKALLVTCLRIGDPAKCSAPVLEAMNGADVPAKRALLRVLGGVGGDKALQAVRGALKDADAKIADAAICALAAWPDPAPAQEVLELAKAAKETRHYSLCLQGYVRMIGLMQGKKPDEKLKLYQDAMDCTRRADEKRNVLSGLAEVPTLAALKMVAPYIEQEGTKEEAAVAAVNIADKMGGPMGEEVGEIIRKALQVTKNKEIIKKGEAVLQKVQKSPPRK